MPLDSQARVPMPRADRGRLGARTRWGPSRTLRLDTLDPVTRDIIRAILTARENAARREAAPVSDDSGAAKREVQRGSAERPAA